jgi:hypothetical protein
MSAMRVFPDALLIVCASLGISGWALWRTSQLPHVGPMLPNWTWPLFWASVSLAFAGFLLYALVSLFVA